MIAEHFVARCRITTNRLSWECLKFKVRDKDRRDVKYSGRATIAAANWLRRRRWTALFASCVLCSSESESPPGPSGACGRGFPKVEVPFRLNVGTDSWTRF